MRMSGPFRLPSGPEPIRPEPYVPAGYVAPQPRSPRTNYTTSTVNTSLNLNRDPTWADGDYLVVTLTTGKTSTPDVPAGFTLLARHAHPDNANTNVSVYGMPLTSGTPGPWSIPTGSGSGHAALVGTAFGGVDTDNPLADVQVSAGYTIGGKVGIGPHTFDRPGAGVICVTALAFAWGSYDLTYHPEWHTGGNSIYAGSTSSAGRLIALRPLVPAEDTDKVVGHMGSPNFGGTVGRPAAIATVLLNRRAGNIAIEPDLTPLHDALGASRSWGYILHKDGEEVSSHFEGWGRPPLANDYPSIEFTRNSFVMFNSISKLVLEMCLRLLEHEGALSLDDLAITHLTGRIPTFGAGFENVTIRHLLAMKAGSTGSYDYDGELESGARSFAATAFDSPGTFYNYNNGCFALLQLILEIVTGDNFYEYARSRIFAPLDMRRVMPAPPPHAAMAGLSDGSSTVWNIPLIPAMGAGLVGTPDEIMRLTLAFRSDAVLPAAVRKAMLSDRYRAWPFPSNHGELLGHSGTWGGGTYGGVRSILLHCPGGYDLGVWVNEDIEVKEPAMACFAPYTVPPTEPEPDPDGGDEPAGAPPEEFGEPYAGGYYAGQIEDGGQTYALVLADAAAGAVELQWAPANDSGHPNSLTDGPGNTDALVAVGSEPALHCRAYGGGGFDDWYLPAQAEVQAVWANLAPDQTAHPDFTTGGSQAFATHMLATSTSVSHGNYSVVMRSGGGLNTSSKTAKSPLITTRPVRRVLLA